jgi:hypothetical protein
MAINMFEGARRMAKLIAVLIVVGSLSACSDKGAADDQVFTLYSTNFPNDSGRHPVATFDNDPNPDLNLTFCQEAADLFQADFERRKRENAGSATWVNAKVRHWCEKGRHKP